MSRPRVLFSCTYYGARSLVAEAFALQLAPKQIAPFSSGFESGEISPLPRQAMQELGFELPAQSPKSVFDRYRDGEAFDYVVIMCCESSKEHCATLRSHVAALFAGQAALESWSIPDFQSIRGAGDERLTQARRIRDEIRLAVLDILSRIGAETGG